MIAHLRSCVEEGACDRVRAPKLNQSWDTLQEALDERGQHAWDLCTTIYAATRATGGLGKQYRGGLICKRLAYAAADSARAPESMSQVRP
jgi:hypothetical protein